MNHIVKRWRDTAAQEILVELLQSFRWHGLRQVLVKFDRFWSKLVLDAAAGSLNLARNLLMASKLPQDTPKIAPRWSKKGQDDQMVAQDKLA